MARSTNIGKACSWSDGRIVGPDGRCKIPAGNSVDLEAANWTNTIGASELAAGGTDWAKLEPGK
jgi:hypothetical protein